MNFIFPAFGFIFFFFFFFCSSDSDCNVCMIAFSFLFLFPFSIFLFPFSLIPFPFSFSFFFLSSFFLRDKARFLWSHANESKTIDTKSFQGSLKYFFLYFLFFLGIENMHVTVMQSNASIHPSIPCYKWFQL